VRAVRNGKKKRAYGNKNNTAEVYSVYLKAMFGTRNYWYKCHANMHDVQILIKGKVVPVLN
jgi:hypothetical protein